jgi:hypothetical protein
MCVLENGSVFTLYVMSCIVHILLTALLPYAASHSVRFPRQPYGAQIVFMSRLIWAIQNRSNALLEAPTGCGKTLAILCGALAWQAKAKKNAEDMEAAEDYHLSDLGLTQGTAMDLRYREIDLLYTTGVEVVHVPLSRDCGNPYEQ